MISWLGQRWRSALTDPQRLHAPLLTTAEIARLAGEGRELALRQPSLLDTRRAGDWQAPRLGQGLDFETARPYMPGDDIRHMDWRSTARSGHAYLRLYREERQPSLHLVIDRGPAMRFGTRRRLKAAQAARVGALLAYASSASRYSLGATLWDAGDVELAAHHGGEAAHALAHAVSRACPPRGPTSAGDEAVRLARLTAILPRGSHIVLISDFTWLMPAHWMLLARLAEYGELWAVVIADMAERRLPDMGLAQFLDLHNGRLSWVDTRRTAAQLAHAFTRRQAELSTRLQDLGARYLLVGSEEESLLPHFVAHAASAQ